MGIVRRIKKIGINTGGGDAPGLNAVIRAVVLTAHNYGVETVGILDGYNGLLDHYPEGIIPLTKESVRGITHLGGTILGTTNKGNPFEYPREINGEMVSIDRSDEIIENAEKEGIDAVVAIGGDGSMSIANKLNQKGLPIIGVPKTIDNDLSETVVTFGFDTAVATATDCIDKLHSTAAAHKRVMIVEVMGRYAGWIALHAGISSTCDVILIPEIPFDINKVAEKIKSREEEGRHFSMVVVAEGAKPKGGHIITQEGKKIGRAERLGGIAHFLEQEIEQLTGKETRAIVLGHLQRGGSPTSTDRLLSLRFGAAAVRTLMDGVTGVMVALDPPRVKIVPLTSAIERMKCVPLDGDTVNTARDLGICLGD